jgi:hypothetical protein
LNYIDIDFSYKKHSSIEGTCAVVPLLAKCSVKKNADMKLVDSEE